MIFRSATGYDRGVDYRTILKDQLERRKRSNPRYSLRSMALKLDLSPSKLSEFMSGKKNMSLARARDVVERLQLKGAEREIFLLSAESRSSPEAERRIRDLEKELSARRTTQRNAWYFGAVRSILEEGMSLASVRLGLTDLQAENAARYLNRIRKFHPDRRELVYEPLSLLKKLEEESLANPDLNLDAEFLFLTSEQAADLRDRIRGFVKSNKAKARRRPGSGIHMLIWGLAGPLEKER